MSPNTSFTSVTSSEYIMPYRLAQYILPYHLPSILNLGWFP